MIGKRLIITGVDLMLRISLAADKILRRRRNVVDGLDSVGPPGRPVAPDRQFEELIRLVEQGRLGPLPVSMAKDASASENVNGRKPTEPSVPPEDLAQAAYRARSQDLASRPATRAAMPKAITSLVEWTPAAPNVVWRTPVIHSDRRRASLPPGVRIYAVGDIHGRADLLGRVLAAIEADWSRRPAQQAMTVFIGDYIDRGPASRQAIDLLLQWRQQHETVFLKGNHETFLSRFLADSRTLDSWRLFGGLETLVSYGLKPTINPDRREQVKLADELAAAVPRDHRHFLQTLKLSYDCGDFLFVHAGIRPNVPAQSQTERDLLWIRDEFLSHEQPFERFIVHGHTPEPALELRRNRINIDTGAFATGRLTCIAIEGTTITPLAT